MERVFDAHVHFTHNQPIEESIRLFRREFEITGTEKVAFMSIPHMADDGVFSFDCSQNIKGLYLKKAFSPNAYVFAGLEHVQSCADTKSASKYLLKQAEEYYEAGFDGMKMLEGYPAMRKFMGVPLCDEQYDAYYSFLEENGIPVTMHIANPAENWDINKVDEYAIRKGRYCDETFPTKAQLHAEVEEILRKHPKLRLTLAHMGFMSYDIEQAKRFLEEYEYTAFDVTPGGEQLLNMLKQPDKWRDFFERYQDKILYGTDLYAFPYNNEEGWLDMVTRRPFFLRRFFETDAEYEYLGEKFRGFNLDKKIRHKIYWENASRMLGSPRNIQESYLEKHAEKLLLTRV